MSRTLFLLLMIYALPALAQLPYNPVRLFLSPDRSRVYQFTPRASQSVLSSLDISKRITATDAPVTIDQNLPFTTANQAAIPIVDGEGISFIIGNCQDSKLQPQLWRLPINKDGKNGVLKKLAFSTSDTTLSANYLSAGFTFSANSSTQDTSLYLFGGMCPSEQSDAANWVSQADYSNVMFSLSPNPQSQYQVSTMGTTSAPISEAGLTITPLSPGSTKSSTGQVIQSQTFVLIGGHTESAFINMSQVATFSLPEASWAYIGVKQPPSTTGELVRRDANAIEPRSGHTAVLTEDGTKIVVFGGWVGDVTNPAQPQLAVISLGQSYGGTTASWEWSVPKQTSSPIALGQGLYGHGAVMLPGNIMMIAGGTSIGTTEEKRSTQNYMFFDLNSGLWSSNYKNSRSASLELDTAQRAGIGAGVGLGLAVLIAVLVVWWLYRRKLNTKRAEREARLRELAFGSERFQSNSRLPSRMGGRQSFTEMRSASWNSRQEQQIENNGFKFPWAGPSSSHAEKPREADISKAERTALDVPSPTRGLRRSLSGRGAPNFGTNAPVSVTGPGSVFRIDEVEEDGSVKSFPTRTNADSRLSDPFKDPPHLEPNPAAEERKREVKGWVEDWQTAAAEMNLSRNPSHARTYSNLSQTQSISESSSYRTGRESPDKSDRTGSNLSERSAFSIQKSTGMVSRQTSTRSVSAGYALFAGAAAAMSRFSGTNKDATLECNTSKRSVSLHNSAPRRVVSGSQRQANKENRSLLRDTSPTKSITEESQIKDYKNYARTSSMTSEKRKMGILGSFKRVLTGTSGVNVQAAVEQYEEKADDTSPTRAEPEMAETPTSPAFWRSKKGAKDWDEVDTSQTPSPTKGHRRSTMEGASSVEDYDGEEWDVETAVQKRVVQVMFTMPKEKLRVVNADALSLISRSDIDEKEDRDRKGELGRMDSVKEDADGNGDDVQNDEGGKGKARAV